MKPKGRNQLNEWLFLFLSFLFPLLLQCAILLYDKPHHNFVFNLSPRIQHDVICHLLFFFLFSFFIFYCISPHVCHFTPFLFFLFDNEFFLIFKPFGLLGSIALLFTFTFFYGEERKSQMNVCSFLSFFPASLHLPLPSPLPLYLTPCIGLYLYDPSPFVPG